MGVISGLSGRIGPCSAAASWRQQQVRLCLCLRVVPQPNLYPALQYIPHLARLSFLYPAISSIPNCDTSPVCPPQESGAPPQKVRLETVPRNGQQVDITVASQVSSQVAPACHLHT